MIICILITHCNKRDRNRSEFVPGRRNDDIRDGVIANGEEALIDMTPRHQGRICTMVDKGFEKLTAAELEKSWSRVSCFQVLPAMSTTKEKDKQVQRRGDQSARNIRRAAKRNGNDKRRIRKY
jgi:hypothetical protein